METKNYTQVLIDGKIYTLGGSEDEAYLQRTASYVNEKNMQLRGIPGFSKQSADYQQVMIQLNLADDYFKALDYSEQMEEERNRMEKESYSLKHELVSTQMKLEAVLKDLEDRQVQSEELTSRLAKLEREIKNLTRQNERLSQERAEAVTEAEQMKALMLHQEKELRAVGEAAASEEEPVFEEKPEFGKEAGEKEGPEAGKETGEETAGEEAAEVSREEAKVPEPAAAPEENDRENEQLEVTDTKENSEEAESEAAEPEKKPMAFQEEAAAAGVVRPVSDEELARRALQAARKAGFHRGRR